MQVTKTVEETRKQIKAWKKEGKTVGLVPTMGFLHEGHASLIKKCREQNDVVEYQILLIQHSLDRQKILTHIPEILNATANSAKVSAQILFSAQNHLRCIMIPMPL